MVDLNCPICGKLLKKNEGLLVSNDAQGTIVVWHLIPREVPTFSDPTPELLNRELDEIGGDMYPSTEMRSWCGNAGYKELSIK